MKTPFHLSINPITPWGRKRRARWLAIIAEEKARQARARSRAVHPSTRAGCTRQMEPSPGEIAKTLAEAESHLLEAYWRAERQKGRS